jgi:MYXO-CTERM domain-containing protein
MVGSTSQNDGVYTDLTIAATAVPINPGTGGTGGSGVNPDPKDDGGCGCTVPGDDGSSGAATAAAIAMAGLFAARRRRRA